MEQNVVLLGNRISAARRARGWSRSDLARKARVDPSYVTRIEEAHYKRPSVDKVRAIAGALSVTVQELTDPPPDPVAVSREDMRSALMAKGFRPDETHIVDQILNDMASKSLNDRQREHVLRVISSMLELLRSGSDHE